MSKTILLVASMALAMVLACVTSALTAVLGVG